jgi:hypothetical protein
MKRPQGNNCRKEGQRIQTITRDGAGSSGSKKGEKMPGQG